MTTLNAAIKNETSIGAQIDFLASNASLNSVVLGLLVSLVPLCLSIMFVHACGWQSATLETSQSLARASMVAPALGSVVVYLNRTSRRNISVTCAVSFALAGFLIGLI